MSHQEESLKDVDARLDAPPSSSMAYRLSGFLGRRIQNTMSRWLERVPLANPWILEMFRRREDPTRYRLLPWSGELAGKYLTSAVLFLRFGQDPHLAETVTRFVDEFIKTQDPETGYLGPWPRGQWLYGKTTPGGKDAIWDFWGHYHCIIGLLSWYRHAGDKSAWDCATRAAGYLHRRVVVEKRPVSMAGAEEMNMAVLHCFLLLYQEQADPRWLEAARAVERDLAFPGAGDYIQLANKGVEFHHMPKPRWESLHVIQGIAELYHVTGDDTYRKAFDSIWWSLLLDRHNTGGWSSGEQATGNPYDLRPIETCCTVAWMAVSVDYLKMTGNPAVADELELATFNGCLGGQHPSGAWWTYNTPMEGFRRAAMDEINFQSSPGAPELNCCSVNGPRGLGMVSEWAILVDASGVYVNFYAAGTFKFRYLDGTACTISMETTYPLDGAIVMGISADRPLTCDVHVRVPAWARGATVTIGGEIIPMKSGTYHAIHDTWEAEAKEVDLHIPPMVHFWPGEGILANQASIYSGPLLLAFDAGDNAVNAHDIPPLDPRAMGLHRVELATPPSSGDEILDGGDGRPWALFEATTLDNQKVFFRDFASAGSSGTFYMTWFEVAGLVQRKAGTRDDRRTNWLQLVE